ncbi:unnamed protein product [Linum tenue]|uniref:Uncharacterized protein n=1 Tax=Linum tenue TaxID=586396 RepID=A0AAV0HXS7_9ROSI|nr:unnamed protein product [Linum tenue]
MVAVGLVWGATDALIRRGALLYDERSLGSPPLAMPPHRNRRRSNRSSSLGSEPQLAFCCSASTRSLS